ncbi:MAG TPA: NADH-quinone oxidoreductase subunit H, partial [Steroidobacteraceae bacterium]|nr:NADH-quinone oxidoreductase subunit H [Steroidobacteraceae bacterium]
KSLEYSGRGAALMKWAGAMKLLILVCIFVNVLATPWGLARQVDTGAVLLAVPWVLLKIFGFVLVLVYIESSLAKLRLFRISEFLGAAFVISVVAMIMRLSEDAGTRL